MLSDEIQSFPIISFLSPFKIFIEVLVNVIRHTSEIKCITMEKGDIYTCKWYIYLNGLSQMMDWNANSTNKTDLKGNPTFKKYGK